MLLRDGAEHVFDIARVPAFVGCFRAGECEMLETAFGEKVHGRQDQLPVVESDLMDICGALPQMHIQSDAVLHPAQAGEASLEIPEDFVFGEHEGVRIPVDAKSAASVVEGGRGAIERADVPFDGQHGVVAQEPGHPFAVGFVVLAEHQKDFQRIRLALAHAANYITRQRGNPTARLKGVN